MINSKILSEYNKDKNTNPIEEQKNYSTRLWWKCKHGHEWQQSLKIRLGKNNKGCVICRSLGFMFPKITMVIFGNINPKDLQITQPLLFFPNLIFRDCCHSCPCLHFHHNLVE